ncbi:MAG TPA: hypothetical protein VGJ67_00580 [Actinomycetota bacterium]
MAAIHRLGTRAGASRAEAREALPGDQIVPHPLGQTTHAISIDAPPASVWSWLVQLGYHRGGWYTPGWIDRVFFSMENPGAERILSEFQGLREGDTVPDGPPGTAWFDVVELVPERHMVLHSTTHLFETTKRLGVMTWVDWTWAFVLEELAPGTTRLVVRARAAAGPRPSADVMWHALIVPSDLLMATAMLRGIRRRAEALRDDTPAPAV